SRLSPDLMKTILSSLLRSLYLLIARLILLSRESLRQRRHSTSPEYLLTISTSLDPHLLHLRAFLVSGGPSIR
ncbi:MAG: hypothetical protein QI199_01640, partial [Candidatus Korarchaeota archaeon]|nr:hypothetical protein [Candidatus Korarchaeota archaeon]